jgi:hypothetical protein
VAATWYQVPVERLVFAYNLTMPEFLIVSNVSLDVSDVMPEYHSPDWFSVDVFPIIPLLATSNFIHPIQVNALKLSKDELYGTST